MIIMISYIILFILIVFITCIFLYVGAPSHRIYPETITFFCDNPFLWLNQPMLIGGKVHPFILPCRKLFNNCGFEHPVGQLGSSFGLLIRFACLRWYCDRIKHRNHAICHCNPAKKQDTLQPKEEFHCLPQTLQILKGG